MAAAPSTPQRHTSKVVPPESPSVMDKSLEQLIAETDRLFKQTADDTISYSYYERTAMSGGGGAPPPPAGGGTPARSASLAPIATLAPPPPAAAGLPAYLTGDVMNAAATGATTSGGMLDWESPERAGLLHRSTDRTFAPTTVVSTSQPISAGVGGGALTTTTTTGAGAGGSAAAVAVRPQTVVTTTTTTTTMTTNSNRLLVTSATNTGPAPTRAVALLQSPNPGSPVHSGGGHATAGAPADSLALNPNTSSASSSTASVSGISAMTSPSSSAAPSASVSPSPQPGAAAAAIAPSVATTEYNAQSLVPVAAAAAAYSAATDSPRLNALRAADPQRAEKERELQLLRDAQYRAATTRAGGNGPAGATDNKYRPSGAASTFVEPASIDGSTRSTYNWRGNDEMDAFSRRPATVITSTSESNYRRVSNPPYHPTDFDGGSGTTPAAERSLDEEFGRNSREAMNRPAGAGAGAGPGVLTAGLSARGGDAPAATVSTGGSGSGPRSWRELNHALMRAGQPGVVTDAGVPASVALIDDRQPAVQQLIRVFGDVLAESAELTRTLRELIDDRNHARADHENCHRDVSTLKGVIDRLRSKVVSQSQTIADLNDRQSTARVSTDTSNKQASVERSAAKQKLANAQNEIRIRDQTISKLQSKVVEADERAAKAVSGFALESSERQTLNATITQLKHQLSHSQNETRLRDQQISKLQHKLIDSDERQTARASQADAHDKQQLLLISQLKHAAAHAQNEVRLREQSITKLQRSVHDLEDERTAYTAKAATADAGDRSAVSTIAQLKHTITQLQADARTKDSLVTKLQRTVTELEDERTRERTKLTAAEASDKQSGVTIVQLKHTISQLTNDGRTKDAHIARLQRSIGELEDERLQHASTATAAEQSDKMQGVTIAQLKHTITQLNSEVKIKEQTVTRHERTIADLEEQIKNQPKPAYTSAGGAAAGAGAGAAPDAAGNPDSAAPPPPPPPAGGIVLSTVDKQNAILITQLKNKLVAAVNELKSREQAMARLDRSLLDLDERLQAKTASAEAAERQNALLIASLKQKLTHCQNDGRVKEQTIAKLRDKLESHVKQHEHKKTREEELFKKLYQRSPRKQSAEDNQALDVIALFTAQREQMQSEIDHLRSEVGNMNEQLKDTKNEQLRKARPFTPRADRVSQATAAAAAATESAANSAVQLARCEDELRTARNEYKSRESELTETIKRAHSEVDTCQRRVKELEEENVNLRLEVDSRPSVDQWRSAQAKLHKAQLQLSESKSVNELRKYMDTRELIRKDKAAHRLDLKQIEQLPSQITSEILTDICIRLELNDVTLVVPTLQKMIKIVGAVPAMQKFVREVCGLVYAMSETLGAVGPGATSYSQLDFKQPDKLLTTVIPTLREWELRLRRLSTLEEFQLQVYNELKKRTTLEVLNRVQPYTNADGTALPNSSAVIASNTAAVLEELRRCVANEGVLLRSKAVFQQADVYLQQNPKDALTKIVSHFQNLFQVKTSDGIIPKMSELYLYVNESTNCLTVLRQFLGLDANATINHCLSAVKRMIDSRNGAPGAAGVVYGQSGPAASADGKMDGVHSFVSGAGAGAPADAASVKKAAETHKLIASVRTLLSLEKTESAANILAAIKRLLARLRGYDELMPGIDRLVSNLYDILRVGDLEAIVPAVAALQHANRATLHQIHRDQKKTAPHLSPNRSAASAAAPPPLSDSAIASNSSAATGAGDASSSETSNSSVGSASPAPSTSTHASSSASPATSAASPSVNDVSPLPPPPPQQPAGGNASVNITITPLIR